ncbi:protein of unknown function [Paraburkholderia dioscoreae]|uniref:Uncharacterized protein n=1 Tax=Paraburkholderia dioscoreae TaxID=2604047 RepID=A0A5Q4ZKQ0_9BURK|nr:protein of unknown function [Paraburkholderia dioscoreae]
MNSRCCEECGVAGNKAAARPVIEEEEKEREREKETRARFVPTNAERPLLDVVRDDSSENIR